MKDKYCILKEEQINIIHNMAEEIYANISLLKIFCKEYYENEDIFKIKYVIEQTHKISDMLYANLIELQADIDK